MDRRTSLNALLGRASAKKAAPTPPKAHYTFTPYNGDWNYDKAAHLLRRTLFGPTKAEIEEAVQLGLAGTLDRLFQASELPTPPLNYFSEIDSVPIGSTWINTAFPRGETKNKVRGARMRSLTAWTTGLLINSQFSIREKMTLFWHNHFVVQGSIVRDPILLYNYISILRENATGNFKDLVKKISIEPAMLRYLNGNQNTRNKPNENYARELLELFTLGKGALAGPGDYTTFTEDDVIAIAKVLTGWRDFGYLSINPENPPSARFIRSRHDVSTKQLSHRFGNAQIENANELEYENLIDLIFEREEAATFICKKLYRWLMYYEIDEQVEQQIIAPMAQLLIENNFEIAPVLKAFLGSQHFYEADLIGPMIKHPLDFVIGMFRQLEINTGNSEPRNYAVWNAIRRFMPNLQMAYFEPPDVAGWKAFYQAPGYYQIWISSATLGPRMELTNQLSTQGIRVKGQRISIDGLALAAQIENSTDPNELINGLAKLLFPQEITQGQKDALKEVLIPGLPDFEWTVEYGDYLANPADNDLKTGAENRLKALLQAMLVMPEFYLS
jgi:uncharacterized protein (DUF1800 family)